MVQVRADEDGTYTLLLDGKAAMGGLTRAQADRMVDRLRARDELAAATPAERVAAEPKRGPRRWLDLFRRRASR